MKNYSKFIGIILLGFILISCKGTAQVTLNDGRASTSETTSARQTQLIATGSKVSPEEVKEFLAHHNMARKEVGSPILVWDAEVAGVAQRYAEVLASNNCDFSHSNNNRYGENLFGGSGRVYTALDASMSWYEEKADYTYSNSDYNHYTQMVWKSTKSVGVGVAICEDGSYIIVANYAPGGNMDGEYPY